MSIKFIEDNINKVYFGDTPIKKIFIGSEKIYSDEENNSEEQQEESE